MVMALFVSVFISTTTLISAETTSNLVEAQFRQPELPAVGQGVGNMRFEQLDALDGLSDNEVQVIYQDSYGFIWLGTREGLNKYDGYTITVFKANLMESSSLTNDNITALAETADGSIWVGTYYGGLHRYDRHSDTFENTTAASLEVGMSSTDRITALLVDSRGRLWIGTDRGLYQYDSFTNEKVYFPDQIVGQDGLSSLFVTSLYEDQDGNLWIGTDNGINLFDRAAGHFKWFLTEIGSGLSNIKSITGGEENLWVGTSGGLISIDLDTYQTRVYKHNPGVPGSLKSDRITQVYQDQTGGLWIGYESHGLSLLTGIISGRLQLTSFTHQPFNENSLSQDAVTAILEDQGGVMWFGTQSGGVNRVNPSTRLFGTYQYAPDNPNMLSAPVINTLAYDSARRSLWIGTAGGGLDRLNLITGAFMHYLPDHEDINSLDGLDVALLHIGPGGDVYAKTGTGVLRVFDAARNNFPPVLVNFTGYRGGENISSITHDHQGRLWSGHDSGIISAANLDTKTITWYDPASLAPMSFQPVPILDIYVDSANLVWLATDGQGLLRFDPDRAQLEVFINDGSKSGPSHNSITLIEVDSAGGMWLGTAGGGLNHFRPVDGLFSYLTTGDGLPSNRIFGVVPDVFGNYWVSTGNGLTHLDPGSAEIRTYNARDGLQGNTFSPRAADSGGGAVFFGGTNGLNAFYPQQIISNQHRPPVAITSVSLYDQVLMRDVVDCSEALELAHDENFLSFELAVLDFSAPENNQYAYKLEGLNQDFVFASDRRHADYPDLTWGEYTFRLIGANNDGVWNTDGACINLVIRRPFWAAWWFISLIGIFLAGSIILGYQWRLKSMESQSQRLALEVYERTREIERRRQMASGLSEVVRLLNTDQPLEKSLDFIVKQSVGLTAASKAAIFERQEDQLMVKACYPAGETNKLNLNDPNSFGARCLLETTFRNQLLIFSKLDPRTMQSETRWELVSGSYRTAFCTPLQVAGEVYGGLVLYYGEDRSFTADEINQAHTLADQASLAITNQQLKGASEAAAVIAERDRLARDLHDAVTQTLFSTSLIAEVLPRLWKKDPDQAQQQLETLQQLTRSALGEMRTLLMELRPSALIDADPAELFKYLTDAFSGRTGVAVQLDVSFPADCELPAEVKIAFYRIAQEGLNNIFKHAEAEKVWLHFTCGKEAVTLTISDNGRGFKPANAPAGRLGLNIMAERAETIGAEFTLVSQPGGGTTLRLVWQFE